MVPVANRKWSVNLWFFNHLLTRGGTLYATLFLITIFLWLLCPLESLWASEPENVPQGIKSPQDFSSLNIRMSHQAISPPPNLVKQTFSLEGFSVARPFEGPTPQAAIIENDHRQRVALLSKNSMEIWQLYLLEPIPLDPQLPGLLQCAEARQCETDRMPLTGGLACLAICVKDLIEATVLDNH